MGHATPHRAVRLPDDLHRRAEALEERLRPLWPDIAPEGSGARAVRLSAAAVLRLAAERGLDALEAEAAFVEGAAAPAVDSNAPDPVG